MARLVLTSSGAEPELLLNETPQGPFLRLLLVGRTGNRDAVGAKIRARVGDAEPVFEVRAGNSYLSQSERTVHVGLGAASPGSVRVEWPQSGARSWSSAFVVVEEIGAVRALRD